jgi:hypothetical protein
MAADARNPPAHTRGIGAGGPGSAEAALWAPLREAGPRGVSVADLVAATGKGRTLVTSGYASMPQPGGRSRPHAATGARPAQETGRPAGERVPPAREVASARCHAVWSSVRPPPRARACACRATHADVRTDGQSRTVTRSRRAGSTPPTRLTGPGPKGGDTRRHISKMTKRKRKR